MRGLVVGNNLQAAPVIVPGHVEGPGAESSLVTSPSEGAQPSALDSQLPGLSLSNGSALHPYVLQVGDLSVDLITDIVERGGKVIELTPLLRRLLKYLMFRAGETCSRKDILKEVWGYDFKPGSMSFLEVRINHLRAAIDKGFEMRMIETVHGVGYRLKAA